MRLDPIGNEGEWLECVLADSNMLLADHAHCERKAAGTALGLVARYPHHSALVDAMVALAVEELGHFSEVHGKLLSRGVRLGADPGDPYARALLGEVRKGVHAHLIDRLLVSAIIEARSCARLVLLGAHHPEQELAEMFQRFASAEGGHAHLFVSLAESFLRDGECLVTRLDTLRSFEHTWLRAQEVRCAMH